MDSTACVHLYASQGFNVQGLFVDYGQPPRHRERLAADKITGFYGINIQHLAFEPSQQIGWGEIVGRNAFLLFSGLMHIGRRAGVLASGVHSGTSYYDCSPDFFHNVQSIFDGYSSGRIQIAAPFLTWDKREIWNYCMKEKVPIDLTYSCERGDDQPCRRESQIYYGQGILIHVYTM